VRRRDFVGLLSGASLGSVLPVPSALATHAASSGESGVPRLPSARQASKVAQAEEPLSPYPVIYSTDLYYTIEDIDDYFDAAVLLNCPEVDIKGIILDNHIYPTDGEKALAKIMEFTKRQIPVVKGLGLFQMRSFMDKAYYVDDPGGVELILRTLRECREKVALIAVGSLTDFAVAYLRDPALLAQKVSAVYMAAGSAESPVQDYNVKLDPKAFVTIMRSKLPIIWVPVDSSMWYFPAPKMLVPEKNALAHFLLDELLYWYLRNDWKAHIYKDRYEYYDLGRWMWSTPAFVHVVRHPQASEMFDLVPAKVEFDDQGVLKSIQLGVEHSNISVVQNVNGVKLNDFIVSRINR
jgi:inosine-uridine nucleoside N-ribohydrolase